VSLLGERLWRLAGRAGGDVRRPVQSMNTTIDFERVKALSRPLRECAITLFLALFAPTVAFAETTLAPDQAVGIALADNPGLAEMRSRAEALAAVPAQAGAMPEPVLTLGAVNVPVDNFDLGLEPMTQLQLGISQALPFPGKLGLQQRAATLDAEAAVEEVNERRLMLARDVRMAWWNLYYLDRALETVGRNQALLRQLVGVAQARYEVGQGLQQDVLLAQVELSRLLDEEVRLKGARRTAQARLNALLGRPATTMVVLPPVAEALPAVGDAESLLARALESRPLLAALGHRADSATARLDRARRDYYPDFRLGVGYGWREDRTDFTSLQLSMNLPIFTGSRQDKAVAQRQNELYAQRDAQREAQVRIGEEIAAAIADFEQSRDRFSLLDRGIVPQARQTAAAMLAGYQVNKVDFLNLVRAQVGLHNHETQRWNSFSAAMQAAAKLRAAVGDDEAIDYRDASW
jgi:outer membrane protein TolC